ncbi:HEPN domain-containing protein [Kangiella marina]
MISFDRDDYFSQTDFLYELCKDDNEKRELLTNLIVIDIVTSIEVYTERLLKQFLKLVNKIGLTTCKINNRLKVEQSIELVDKLSSAVKNGGDIGKVERQLLIIKKLWSEGESFNIDCKVKYPKGKHGELQLKKLFEKVGIDNIFRRIDIPQPESSLLDEDDFDTASFIGELTAKRNLAIHEGAPLHASISLETLEFYINTSSKVLTEFTRVMNEELAAYQGA